MDESFWAWTTLSLKTTTHNKGKIYTIRRKSKCSEDGNIVVQTSSISFHLHESTRTLKFLSQVSSALDS